MIPITTVGGPYMYLFVMLHGYIMACLVKIYRLWYLSEDGARNLLNLGKEHFNHQTEKTWYVQDLHFKLISNHNFTVCGLVFMIFYQNERTKELGILFAFWVRICWFLNWVGAILGPKLRLVALFTVNDFMYIFSCWWSSSLSGA